MSSAFETLYGLAIEIRVNPDFSSLTRHHRMRDALIENGLVDARYKGLAA